MHHGPIIVTVSDKFSNWREQKKINVKAVIIPAALVSLLHFLQPDDFTLVPILQNDYLQGELCEILVLDCIISIFENIILFIGFLLILQTEF